MGYFARKKEIYNSSFFCEARDIALWQKSDFIKEDILNRNQDIYNKLKQFFAEKF